MACKNESVRLFWIFFSICLIELSILWKTCLQIVCHETLFQMLFIMFLKTNQADTFLNCLSLLRRIRNRKEWNINNIKEHKLKQFVSKSDITGHAMRSLFVTFFCLPYFPNL